MKNFQQGWRENNQQTNLKDLKESVEMLNEPFGGMLDTEEEKEYSEDYPLGGCIEQYDIEREIELTQ